MNTVHTTQVSHEITPQVHSVWKNKNFIILFFSGAILSIGNRIYELALPLMLYEMTHSSVAMTTMRAIEFLPNLLLAMFIGVLVDRANKKVWSLWMIGVQIFVLLSLFSLIQLGHLSLIVFYICGFLLMTFNYGYYNARFSIVKNVLPTELLTSANAKFSFISTLISIMGPAISVFILSLSDLHDGLLFTSFALIIAFFTMNFLTYKEILVPVKREPFMTELKEGWVALRNNRPLWLITLLVIFLNSTAGMFDAMVIFYAKDNLNLSNQQLGFALSMAGLGGLAGSTLVPYARKNIRTGHLLGITILLLGGAYFIMFLADNIYLLGVALFFEGLFATIQSVCIWTFRQETTPSYLIGRISGITGSLFKLGMPLTIFGSGWVSVLIGSSYVFLGAALFNVIIFLFYRKLSLWKLH